MNVSRTLITGTLALSTLLAASAAPAPVKTPAPVTKPTVKAKVKATAAKVEHNGAKFAHDVKAKGKKEATPAPKAR